MFTSDRENQSNLFRYDLDTGLITQMTDLKGKGRPGGCQACLQARGQQRALLWLAERRP